jgi:transposase
MYVRIYDVIPQNGDCSRESNVRTLVFRNKVRYQNATSLQNSIQKDSHSDKAIRRWLKQFQETGRVLHRKGAGRPSTSQEVVDRSQEVFFFEADRNQLVEP